MGNAISDDGLALIQRCEGFRAEPAPLPGGGWVVGHGHVRIGQAGPLVSQSEAAALLALDLAPVERLVNALVSRPLTQSQFDALVSFALSVGADAFAGSQVLRRVNAGDVVAAACAMDAWRKADVCGELEIVDALVRRRAAEKALFLKDLPHEAAPSVLMPAKLDHAAAILGAPTQGALSAGARAIAPSFVEDNVVALARGRIDPPKFEPTVRLTQILQSEPATNAALMAQVANDIELDDDEIVTAHAKPVARALDDARQAARRAFEAQQAERRFAWFKRQRAARTGLQADRRLGEMRARQAAQNSSRPPLLGPSASIEHFGLAALLVFGLGLISLGASLLFNGSGDIIDIVAAAAIVTPGLAAALMAAFGLWRMPREHAA